MLMACCTFPIGEDKRVIMYGVCIGFTPHMV